MVNVEAFEKYRANDYLRRLADSDIGRHYKAIALEQLDIQPGHTVVDLGCGPGADLGSFAAATGPAGRVVGIDSDAAALTEARSDIRAGEPIALYTATFTVSAFPGLPSIAHTPTGCCNMWPIP
ncbi:Ubiquinone/menaquinone biosynthesis C-methyltransferase UbiE [Nocardia cerradoensis]|uniref:Ubiquinone/menaquinone biosynthesis C-methyltransferase UbiE n=1 Tax=Nocardia cerradoensis TaxID=85688 RepID=A0A231HFZ1_9NOCA|nr:methyltransferase domain-containing protein [Nocardia cerradoensis]OXR47804.1 Ubiquinone/menaquinone biosynthesis C-methyltransferase UbiE [Nocardia cerradoensis]